MESRFPLSSSCWLGWQEPIFSPNSMSFRPCSLCSDVFPWLPMSHQIIRCAANSTSQHGILASGGTLVPMRCSSAAFSVLAWLAGHEAHCTFDDPAGMAFPPVVSPGRFGFPLGELVRISFAISQSKFRSWNQHRPYHRASPFTDDQHKSRLFFRFPLSKEPGIHRHMGHPFQIVLSIGSPVRCFHTTSHHAELAP